MKIDPATASAAFRRAQASFHAAEQSFRQLLSAGEKEQGPQDTQAEVFGAPGFFGRAVTDATTLLQISEGFATNPPGDQAGRSVENTGIGGRVQAVTGAPTARALGADPPHVTGSASQVDASSAKLALESTVLGGPRLSRSLLGGARQDALLLQGRGSAVSVTLRSETIEGGGSGPPQQLRHSASEQGTETNHTAMSLTLLEAADGVEVVVSAQGLPIEARVRFRRLASAMLREVGGALDRITINGRVDDSRPEQTQGDAHGDRSR